MRIKTEYDRQGLLAIGGIVDAVLTELCRAAAPGVTTAQLDDLATKLLAERDASSAALAEYGFPGSVCVSVNEEVVHAIPGGRILRDGDLVKIDLTASRRGFVADATRMVLIPPVDDLSRRLADCARRACLAAIAQARVGARLADLGGVIQAEAERDGFLVIRELSGHGIGRSIHEAPVVPNYLDSDNEDILRKGAVITIEPIISASAAGVREAGDGWTLVTADGARTGHYEETVIVGPSGAEVATAQRPLPQGQ